MAQRQFRSDDTSLWTDKYGVGSNGALSQNTATDATPNTTITGTASSTAGTVGSGTGFANGNLVLVHQSQGTGVGIWEFNKISSVGGGTNWTMAYNFMNTYSAGAQVYLLKQYTTATINTSQTLTGLTWNGSTGAVLAILANQSITVTGNIVLTGLGYRGGAGAVNSSAIQGEGETGTGSGSVSANGSGGGGGKGGTGPGTGGNTFQTVTDLSSHFVPGGAGGGGDSNAGSGATGGAGGGMVLLVARSITVTGSIVVNGSAGTVGSDSKGGSGGGGGGCILLKCQTSSLGSTIVTSLGGAGGGSPGINGDGGAGGAGASNGVSGGGTGTGGVGTNGTIHVDYVGAPVGTTSPAASTRFDSALADQGALFFAMP